MHVVILRTNSAWGTRVQNCVTEEDANRAAEIFRQPANIEAFGIQEIMIAKAIKTIDTRDHSTD